MSLENIQIVMGTTPAEYKIQENKANRNNTVATAGALAATGLGAFGVNEFYKHATKKSDDGVPANWLAKQTTKAVNNKHVQKYIVKPISGAYGKFVEATKGTLGDIKGLGKKLADLPGPIKLGAGAIAGIVAVNHFRDAGKVDAGKLDNPNPGITAIVSYAKSVPEKIGFQSNSCGGCGTCPACAPMNNL